MRHWTYNNDVADVFNPDGSQAVNDNALWSTQFKLAGSASLPYGVRLGANFQSRPGSERSINYAVVRSILPTLTQTSVNVRLNEPGSAYNDRVNQLDLTISKVINVDRLRVRPEVAVFNAERESGPEPDESLRAVARQRAHDPGRTAVRVGLNVEF